ncbi:MAG: biotin/lipoyl-containing protein, partial [Candidatus Rokuibacteriota bacterium]
MTAEVRIPQLGESVTEGTIARWLKQDGDVVEAEEPVLELETDKATMEIPAGASGQLSIVEPPGAVVHVGTVVARITEGAPAAKGAPAAARAARTAPAAAPPPPTPPTPPPPPPPPAPPPQAPA